MVPAPGVAREVNLSLVDSGEIGLDHRVARVGVTALAGHEAVLAPASARSIDALGNVDCSDEVTGDRLVGEGHVVSTVPDVGAVGFEGVAVRVGIVGGSTRVRISNEVRVVEDTDRTGSVGREGNARGTADRQQAAAEVHGARDARRAAAGVGERIAQSRVHVRDGGLPRDAQAGGDLHVGG